MIKLIALDLLGVLVKPGESLVAIGEKVPRTIFDDLKERYPDIKVVIATNYSKSIRETLEHNYPLADEFVISSELPFRKPELEYFNYILYKYDLSPEEMLFLDDSHVNTSSASSLGIQTMTIAPADDVFDKINELLSKKGWHTFFLII